MSTQSSPRSVPAAGAIFEWMALVGAVSAILALGWRSLPTGRSVASAGSSAATSSSTAGLLDRGLDAADGWIADVGAANESASDRGDASVQQARAPRASASGSVAQAADGRDDERVERASYEYERQEAAIRHASTQTGSTWRDPRAAWRESAPRREFSAAPSRASSLDDPLGDDEVTDEQLEMERRSFAALENAANSRDLRLAQAAPYAAPRTGARSGDGAGGAAAADSTAAGSSSGGGPSGGGASSGSAAGAAAANAPKSRKDDRKQLKQAIGGVEQKIATALDSGFYAAADVSFLSPLREPHQVVGIKDLVTQQAWGQGSETGLGAGIRLTAGLMPQDQGFRVRWFTMESDYLTMAPPVPSLTKPAFSSSSYVSLNAVDLEYTQRFCAAGHRIDSSFGMRLADIELQSNTVGYGDVGNNVSLYGMAMSASELQGIGFTGSLGGHVSLPDLFGRTACGTGDLKGGMPPATPSNDDGWPCWLSAWGVYYNFRGSVLWSDASVSVLTDANAVVQGGAANGSAFSRNKAHAADDGRGVTGNFEMQFGLEYQRCLQRFPSNLFFRVGLEYQRWGLGDLGASSRSEAFLAGSSPVYGGQVAAVAQRTDNYLDLFGIAVSLGLTY